MSMRERERERRGRGHVHKGEGEGKAKGKGEACEDVDMATGRKKKINSADLSITRDLTLGLPAYITRVGTGRFLPYVGCFS
jgi:hypothetical protein